jgi:REP element-mobilizing transposase RayT
MRRGTGRTREQQKAIGEQLLLIKQRGGKRRGAGRRPKGERAGSPHRERPFHDARYPVHVVLRAVRAVGNLRRRSVYHAIRKATRTTARREDFRIVHLSIQHDHVHLLIEANDKAALASGMQGFQISAAKHLNAAISKERPGPARRGSVFPDRYHPVVIKSPTQARHALSYVINNWRKHQEDRSAITRGWDVDWFSSAPMFRDWQEHDGKAVLLELPPRYDPLLVHPPKTWLLSAGWKISGPVSYRAVPSRR